MTSSIGQIQPESPGGQAARPTDASCRPDCAQGPLKIYRDTPVGMIPCDGGQFVRLDEAARYFEWQTINRVLALLQTFEGREVSRKLLYSTLIEMRPIGYTPEPEQER